MEELDYYEKAVTSLSLLTDNITGTMLHLYKKAFPEVFFNYTHVSTAKNLTEVKKQLNKKDVNWIKNKPILIVDPVIDLGYESPYDNTLMGEKMYNNFSTLNRYNTSRLFQDNEKGIHLDFIFNEYKINMKFDILLETQMQYYDTFNLVKNSFLVEKPYYIARKLDIGIPNLYMEYMSNATGLKLGSPELLEYMNSYSIYPITYKLNKSSDRYQYFMFTETNFRLNFIKVSGNEGSRDGFDRDDFLITQDVEVIFKAPSIFYYISHGRPSRDPIINTIPTEDEDILPLFTLQIDEFPEVDVEGRGLLSNTIFKIEEKVEEDEINLYDVISTRYMEVIEYCEKAKMDYRHNINFIIYKDDKPLTHLVGYKADLTKKKVFINDICTQSTYRIIIYINFNFMNGILDKIRVEEDKTKEMYIKDDK